MSRIKDYVGKTSGKLLVLHFDKIKNNKYYWKCLCECGTEVSVPANAISCKTSKSCGCSRRVGGETYFWNQKYSSYKRRAKKKNITFNIKLKDFIVLCKQNCHYSNTAPLESFRIFKGRGQNVNEEYAKTYIVKSNGLDRVDNRKGYTLGNVVPCCAKCNIMKFQLGKDEFLEHIQKIYNHSIKDR